MVMKIILVIIGLLIGYLLYNLVQKKRSYHGPRESMMEKVIFKKNNKCFKMTYTVFLCPTNISMNI